MMKKKRGLVSLPPAVHDKDRLAESSIAAVDLCGCGVMHLHIGALTLRLAPSAILELAETLGDAVVRHSAKQSSENGPRPIPCWRIERGEA